MQPELKDNEEVIMLKMKKSTECESGGFNQLRARISGTRPISSE